MRTIISIALLFIVGFAFGLIPVINWERTANLPNPLLLAVPSTVIILLGAGAAIYIGYLIKS